MRSKAEEVRDLERVFEKKSQGAWRPLSKRMIGSTPNWHQWLHLWDCADDLRTMDSLLHIGYDVLLEARSPEEPRNYNQTDRHRLYLTIADGWNDQTLLRSADEGDRCYNGYDDEGRMIIFSQEEARQRLAVKAFYVLCLRFFKRATLMYDSERFDSIWLNEVVTDTMLPKIMEFFRPENRFGAVRIRNLTHHAIRRTHQEGSAINFLLNLSQFLWGWEGCLCSNWSLDDKEKIAVEACNAKIRALINSAKPWMIEVLHELGRLDMLDKWSLDLDQTCLDKLTEIALRSQISHHVHDELVNDDRPVGSVEEACLVGSPAAWFLKRREIMLRERNRLLQIREAEQQAHEAAERLKQLSNPAGNASS